MKPDAHAQPDRPFDGGAFHPELPGGRASGTVRLVGRTVRFESDKGGFELPLDGLKLEIGGANDRLVFLTHPNLAQTTVHTADHAILDHPAITGSSALAVQRARIRKKKNLTVVVLASFVGVLVAGIIALVLARGALVQVAANSVPVEWEIKAGNALFDQMMISRRVIKDPALDAQLKQLTDPLVNGIADKRYPLTFHLVEDATLNAFAMPGGHVVLHSGLLLAADTPEEVAGVLAHEIAHVTRRHSIRNIVSSAGLYFALTAVIGDVSGLLAVLADNSAFLLNRKFSRDFEREADDLGWDYLVRSHIEPKGMITFFQKMQKEEKAMLDKLPVGGVEKALEVFGTHPATAERITHLEARWAAAQGAGGYQNIPLNYEAFKASVRAKLHSASKEVSPK